MIAMLQPSLEISGASIVLVGSFNPKIFQPEWFGKQLLLPQSEADNANIQIIHPQVAQFETERFYFQATTDRITAQTKPNTVSGPLKDLIIGTFYVLEHTPIQAMGLNRQMHFAMKSEEAWHQLGDKLAPKDIWNTLEDRRPGMRNLEILYSSDPIGSSDKPATTVQIQPSIQVGHGVYFEVNNHFTAGVNDGTKTLMDILTKQWEGLQNNAERIANEVLGWAAG
jgi:hypothetical protein